MPATQTIKLHNAITAHLTKGTAMDALASDWLQWFNNDRRALDAGGVATFPVLWGQLMGWWRRYDFEYSNVKRLAAQSTSPKQAANAALLKRLPKPATLKPSLMLVANDEKRRVFDAGEDVARAAEKAARGIADGVTGLTWGIVIPVLLIVLLIRRER